MYEPPGTQYIQCDQVQVQAVWWLQLFNFCLSSHQPATQLVLHYQLLHIIPTSLLFPPCLYFNSLIYKSWDLGRTPNWLGGLKEKSSIFKKNKRQNYSQLYIELWPQFTKWFWKVQTFPLCNLGPVHSLPITFPPLPQVAVSKGGWKTTSVLSFSVNVNLSEMKVTCSAYNNLYSNVIQETKLVTILSKLFLFLTVLLEFYL